MLAAHWKPFDSIYPTIFCYLPQIKKKYIIYLFIYLIVTSCWAYKYILLSLITQYYRNGCLGCSLFRSVRDTLKYWALAESSSWF